MIIQPALLRVEFAAMKNSRICSQLNKYWSHALPYRCIFVPFGLSSLFFMQKIQSLRLCINEENATGMSIFSSLNSQSDTSGRSMHSSIVIIKYIRQLHKINVTYSHRINRNYLIVGHRMTYDNIRSNKIIYL